MRVILVKDVLKVGKRGEIVTVSDGYGANFLIPKGLAKIANDKSLEEYKIEKEEERKQIEIKRKEAEELKGIIESITLEFSAKAGKNGVMIGTISTKQVEKFLKDKYNVSIDKHKFVDKYPINGFGFTNLKIELFKGIIANIKVHVSEEK